MGLYEQVLAAGAQPVALAPPRPSAAIVPWRDRGDGRIEVYWVERAPSLRFMAGWHAFPGGGVSRRDAPVPVAGQARDLSATSVLHPPPESLLAPRAELAPDGAPGVVAAALRELFEETGVLVATRGLGERALGRLPTCRRRLLARESTFGVLLEELEAELDASRLVFAGRWITPPFAPIRFDNRFFLLEWPETEPQQPSIEPGELVDGAWIEPAEALRRWQTAEVLTAPPIVYLLEKLALGRPEDRLADLQRPHEADLGPMRRVEMRPGLLLFPMATATLPPATHTNAYLVGTGESVLVDPGSHDPAEQDRLLDALAVLARKEGRRAVEIWLTHHHPDHVGGAERIAGTLGIPIASHPETASRVPFPVEGRLVDGFRRHLPGPLPLDLAVLHTPGHARGHVALWIEAHGSLVAGDTISALSTIVVDPPEGDMTAYLGTLERLAQLDAATLFPGHGPPLLDGRTRFTDLIAHRLHREERIRAAWVSGVHDPPSIARLVYDGEIPEALIPVAARQVVAHLDRLRASADLDGGSLSDS